MSTPLQRPSLTDFGAGASPAGRKRTHLYALELCGGDFSKYEAALSRAHVEALDREKPLDATTLDPKTMIEAAKRLAVTAGISTTVAFERVMTQRQDAAAGRTRRDDGALRAARIGGDLTFRARLSPRGAGGASVAYTAAAEIGSVSTFTGDADMSDSETIARINALQPNGAPPLKITDVYVQKMEALNTLFLPDRHGFFSASTVNCAVAAARQGQIAFMNSHRTGGLLTASELPMGRTFGGRVETVAGASGGARTRGIFFIYMLRNSRPNGSGSPSTDDLNAAINAGTVFDVSVGFPSGTGSLVCDVCQNDMFARDSEGAFLCKHFPGSTMSMTDSERTKQRARGVPNGAASWTLTNATPHEVSAVYGGAVPYAGFTNKGGLTMATTSTPIHQKTTATPTRETWIAAEKTGDRAAKVAIDAHIKSLCAADNSKNYVQHLTAARIAAMAA